jgi:hypothetical protein
MNHSFIISDNKPIARLTSPTVAGFCRYGFDFNKVKTNDNYHYDLVKFI